MARVIQIIEDDKGGVGINVQGFDKNSDVLGMIELGKIIYTQQHISARPKIELAHSLPEPH